MSTSPSKRTFDEAFGGSSNGPDGSNRRLSLVRSADDDRDASPLSRRQAQLLQSNHANGGGPDEDGLLPIPMPVLKHRNYDDYGANADEEQSFPVPSTSGGAKVSSEWASDDEDDNRRSGKQQQGGWDSDEDERRPQSPNVPSYAPDEAEFDPDFVPPRLPNYGYSSPPPDARRNSEDDYEPGEYRPRANDGTNGDFDFVPGPSSYDPDDIGAGKLPMPSYGSASVTKEDLDETIPPTFGSFSPPTRSGDALDFDETVPIATFGRTTPPRDAPAYGRSSPDFDDISVPAPSGPPGLPDYDVSSARDRSSKSPDFDTISNLPQFPNYDRISPPTGSPKYGGARGSLDYGRLSDQPRSPDYDRLADRPMPPDFDRLADRPRSPDYDRLIDRQRSPTQKQPADRQQSPSYDRSAGRPESLDYKRVPDRSRSPDYNRVADAPLRSSPSSKADDRPRSPDYGRIADGPRSPDYERLQDRHRSRVFDRLSGRPESPDYNRLSGQQRSPEYNRVSNPPHSPDYGRMSDRARSPDYDRLTIPTRSSPPAPRRGSDARSPNDRLEGSPRSPDYERLAGQAAASKDFGPSSGPAPDYGSPDYDRFAGPPPQYRQRASPPRSPDYDRLRSLEYPPRPPDASLSRSPQHSHYNRRSSRSPNRNQSSRSPGYGRSPPRSPDYDQLAARSRLPAYDLDYPRDEVSGDHRAVKYERRDHSPQYGRQRSTRSPEAPPPEPMEDDTPHLDSEASTSAVPQSSQEPQEDPQITYGRVLGAKDSIMEVNVLQCLRQFVASKGNPATAVQLLSESYRGYAQMANLVSSWLDKTEEKAAGTHSPGHAARADTAALLADLVFERFDPKRADIIFAEAASAPEWLEELIQHAHWRALIYRLSEKHRQCLMLNFAIQKISEAGHQMEIASVSSACTNFGVFNRVMSQILSGMWGRKSDAIAPSVADMCKLCSTTQHTYMYTQLLLRRLSSCPKGEKLRRISQELEAHAMERQNPNVVRKLRYAIENVSDRPSVATSLNFMLQSGRTNPGDIVSLHELYSGPDPPPASLLRMPDVLDLLVQDLFNPTRSINPQYRSQHVYLLAYAASVDDRRSTQRGQQSTKGEVAAGQLSKKHLGDTIAALNSAQSICQKTVSGMQTQAIVSQLLPLVQFPVVAMGVLCWIRALLTDKQFYTASYHAASAPVYLDVLRQIADQHPLQRPQVLDVLAACFEVDPSDLELDALQAVQMKRSFLDALLRLLREGCVLPVLAHVERWTNIADQSLIRYFVTQVLGMVASPFSTEFVQSLIRIMACPATLDALRSDEGSPSVAKFIRDASGGGLKLTEKDQEMLHTLEQKLLQ